jgi:NADPH:quinone reductase-like Zn-dependent oxidoreductase
MLCAASLRVDCGDSPLCHDVDAQVGVARRVLALTEGRGVDGWLDCVGSDSTVAGVSVLKHNGTMVGCGAASRQCRASCLPECANVLVRRRAHPSRSLVTLHRLRFQKTFCWLP